MPKAWEWRGKVNAGAAGDAIETTQKKGVEDHQNTHMLEYARIIYD